MLFGYRIVTQVGLTRTTPCPGDRRKEDPRCQGFLGPTMAAQAELAYTGIVDTLEALDKEFFLR
jgi:hypothetical protein